MSDNTFNTPPVPASLSSGFGPYVASKLEAAGNAVKSTLTSVKDTWSGFWSPVPTKGITDQIPSDPNAADTNTPVVTYPGPGGGTIANNTSEPVFPSTFEPFFEPAASQQPTLDAAAGTGGPGTFKVSDNTSNSPTVAQTAPSIVRPVNPGFVRPPVSEKNTVVPVVTSVQAPPIVSGVAKGGVAPIEGIKTPAILAPLPLPVSTQIVTGAPRVPLATACSGSSLANCLSSNNLPSDFYARKTLADSLGIDNYTGTSDQNIALLDDLVTNGYIAPQFFPPTALFKAASSYEGDSVVDFLSAAGQPSSFSERAALARKYGITGYKGTIKQNQQLLAALRATIRQ